jgi:hypothetical protein
MRRTPPVLRGILIAVSVVAVVFVIVVALQPSEYRVVRTASIPAPSAAVFAHVNDFHKWEAWSPWAKLDPAAKNAFEGAPAGTGAVFTWSGNSNVVRPFSSTATAQFTFEPEGGQTAVTWSMAGERR